MHYSKLAAKENQLKETGVAAGRNFKLVPFELPIEGEELSLHGYTVRPADGFEGYFYPQKYQKRRISLHFTVGHLQGDINSLTNPSRGHVSTAFVIGRDGTAYQLFSSYFWSYHLGKGAIGGNGTGSKYSIGIEMSNYGPLVKRGDNLETVYSKREGHDVFCSLADTDQYVELETPFRGHKYYATFTDEQYDNLIVLLRYLTSRYKIPRAFIDADSRFEATEANALFSGINSHVNTRTDKVDIGPAFDWDRVIAGVTAETYNSNPLAKKVAEIEKKVETAKAELKKLEEELMFAQQEYEDSLAVGSRGLGGGNTALAANEKVIDTFVRRPIDAGEDGFLTEDMDKSMFYLED